LLAQLFQKHGLKRLFGKTCELQTQKFYYVLIWKVTLGTFVRREIAKYFNRFNCENVLSNLTLQAGSQTI